MEETLGLLGASPGLLQATDGPLHLLPRLGEGPPQRRAPRCLRAKPRVTGRFLADGAARLGVPLRLGRPGGPGPGRPRREHLADRRVPPARDLASRCEPDDAVRVHEVEIRPAPEGLEPDRPPVAAADDGDSHRPLPPDGACPLQARGGDLPPKPRGEGRGSGRGAPGRLQVDPRPRTVHVQHEILAPTLVFQDEAEAGARVLVDGDHAGAAAPGELPGDAQDLRRRHALAGRGRRGGGVLRRRHSVSWTHRRRSGCQSTRPSGNHRPSSKAAVSAPSEPWTMLNDLLMPKSPRMVPAGA